MLKINILKINRMSHVLVLTICFFSHSLFAAEIESSRRFGMRVNPLIVFIGGNIDFDIFLHSNFSIGPSYFGWGGCGARQRGSEAADGSQCNTWSNIGVRANYYFDFADSSHLIYVGPGLYQTKKSFSYRSNSQTLTGDLTGTTATLIVGYMYQSLGSLNVSAGVGGLSFLDKNSEVLVSDGNASQATISSGPSTQLLIEAALGWRF